MLSDKSKFIDFLDSIGIKYKIINQPNCIMIDNYEVDDWDLEEYTTILIEFNDYDKYHRFRLLRSVVCEDY